MDVYFLPETLDFQLQLYKSYENNICFLTKQFKEFFNQIGSIEEILKSNNIGQEIILTLLDFLNIFTDEMIRKFISNIKEFRKLPIVLQSKMVLNSKHWLTCIILAFIYANIQQHIQINSIIFSDIDFHNNFLQLIELLKILANTDECFVLNQDLENENDENNEEQKKKAEDPEKVDDVMGNEMEIENNNEQFLVKSKVIEFPALIKSNLVNNFYNAFLKTHSLHDPNKFDWQQYLKTDKIKTTEENGIKVLLKIDDDDNKKILLRLKEKYRFLPLFICYIMLHNCNEKEAVNVRNIIFDILTNELNLFDKFTHNQTGTTIMTNDDLSIIFNNPNLNDKNIKYLNKFATSKMNKFLEKLSQLLFRLLAIIQIKYSILP